MKKQTRKIVLVGNVPSFLILFRRDLVIDLLSKGYEVYCMANGYSEQERVQVEGWGAIAVNHSLDVKGLSPWADIKATYQLYKALKKIQPDVVLASFVKPVIFTAVAAWLAKVKIKVGMIEGLGNAFTPFRSGFDKKARVLKKIQVFLYKISLPLLDKLILLNPDDKKDLVDFYNIPVKQLHILGGIGVDLVEYGYTKPEQVDGKVVFLFIGRLVEAKGIFEFIEAAEIVKKNYPETVFRVIGGLDEKNPFAVSAESISQFVAQGVIEYKGHVRDVIKEIQGSHVFVLPSYREGVPRSTQEAMAIGRAVITTDVPGCNVTVQSGVNGFLVPLWDVPELVDKMIFFLENRSEIVRMGVESRRMAENLFDVKKINHTLINIIES